MTAAIDAALAAIPDPELPMLTITELGMVHDVRIEPDVIHVAILPTFIGCPALDLIAAAIRDGLAGFGRDVVVEPTFVVPWTTDRITPSGLAALARAGIAAPGDPSTVRCPYCRSDRVAMDSVFGPTQCRSLFYCRACRQPFEAMKPV